MSDGCFVEEREDYAATSSEEPAVRVRVIWSGTAESDLKWVEGVDMVPVAICFMPMQQYSTARAPESMIDLGPYRQGHAKISSCIELEHSLAPVLKSLHSSNTIKPGLPLLLSFHCREVSSSILGSIA